MKKCSRLLVVVLALCLIAGTALAEHKTLTFIVPSNVTWPNGFDDVLAKFEEQTKDTLDVSLGFTFTGFDDIGQKVSLKLTAGEPMDSVFAAQWTKPSLNEMALKEQVYNLDKYFHNDDYPGLKAAFGEEYLRANSFVGSDGQYHVYGIPFSNSFSAGSLFYYRKDLADKYGITIENEEDVIAYWDAILANEPGMIPFTFLGNTDPLISVVKAFYSDPTAKHNTFDYGRNTYGIIRDDGTVYIAKSVVPELDEEYRQWMDDAARGKTDPLWAYRIAKEWADKGYIDPDVMSVSDFQGQFTSGKAASFVRGADTYEGVETQLKAMIPGAELGYIISERAVRSGAEHQIGTTFQAWNFAAIPVTCPDPDLVMKFYDWLFSSQENHDLFEYGIEGVHWSNDGPGKYTPIADANGKAYNFDAFVMTWLPAMTRYSSTSPDGIIAYKKMMAEESAFHKIVKKGFSFVEEKVSSEVAKLAAIDDLVQVVKNGFAADIEAEIKAVNQKREAAGLDVYIEEFTEQFNAFLKENPYEGQ